MPLALGDADRRRGRQRRALHRGGAFGVLSAAILLPESSKPFCLFLDELPACTPDIQKAFYSLLLERRLGEHALPPGTWVVAAGNRSQDRALVRTISTRPGQSRGDPGDPGRRVGMAQLGPAFRRPPRRDRLCATRPGRTFPPGRRRRAAAFSTPRAWASLSRAFDLVESAGFLDDQIAERSSRDASRRKTSFPSANGESRPNP